MRKIRKRINIDRTVWQKLRELQFGDSQNFSELVAYLLKDYLSKERKVKTKPGPMATIDITIDNNLWEKAKKQALVEDMSMSQLVRRLLKNYLESKTGGKKP